MDKGVIFKLKIRYLNNITFLNLINKKTMQKSSIVVAAITALGIIITAYVLGNAIQNRNTADDTIKVVGLGTKDFVSDEILWTGSFSAKSFDAKEAYNKILEDKEKVKEFFISKGFSEGEFKFGGIHVEKRFRSIYIRTEKSYESRTETVFDGYEATQDVTFTAKKKPELMAKIEQVADQTAELINSGIEFNGRTIQYTYSDLPSLKHSLIEKATADAKDRADKIIKTAKGKRGKLKTASMGVFQITGMGSNEEDSYGGNFDIYNKNKTARITVRLTYHLQ